jgi:branched-subunit amino acid transport protein AzlD
VFAKGTPNVLRYLGQVLPASIMAMLVVYCLKSTSIVASPHGIPELISVLLVVVLHKWRHNTLLSIVSGTLCYMLMVQVVFA